MRQQNLDAALARWHLEKEPTKFLAAWQQVAIAAEQLKAEKSGTVKTFAPQPSPRPIPSM